MLALTPPIILVVMLTLLSAFCDSLGLMYASRVWQENTLRWNELRLSAAGFSAGVMFYWLAVRYLNQTGIVAPELQAVLWFGTAAIGVAILSGQFLSWPRLDQAVALAVLLGIGWLLWRTGS
jgi:hypothetical protein